MRDLYAANRLPVAQHEIVVGVARNIVVVKRADRRRQMRLGIEQNGELGPIVGVRDRRQRLSATAFFDI